MEAGIDKTTWLHQRSISLAAQAWPPRSTIGLASALFFIVFSAFSNAQDEVEESEADPAEVTANKEDPTPCPSLTERTVKFFAEDGRETIGSYYVGAATAIDSFLSGDRMERNQNNSYLKGELRGTRFENGEYKNDARLKAKVRLPNTKKKARLFFDSDLREQDSLDERVRSVSRGEQVERSSSTAGIEFIKQKKDPYRWSHSVKGGIKLNKSFDPFIRYRLQKKWQVNDSTMSYFNQDFYYLDGVGWGESTRHRLMVNPENNFSLYIVSELEYRDEPIPQFFYHQWRLTQKINSRTYFSYNVGMLSEDAQKKFINKRVYSTDFRYRLPGDWFYLTLTPELLQQKENHWENEWSLTLRLEFFFTEEQDSAFYRRRSPVDSAI